MILDETTVTEALHRATSDLTGDPDLVEHVRQGGRRRLHRRRILETAGVLVVAAAIVPAAIELAPNHNGKATVQIGSSPTAAVALYAAPPPAGAQCNGGHADPASDAAYPQLLMLPTDQSVAYAFTNSQTSSCAPAHVALTMLATAGNVVTRGVVIEGPNAATAAESGYGANGQNFTGETRHPQIYGQAASVLYIPAAKSATVFWTGADGSQWQASTRGLSPSAIATLLNRVQFDAQTGTASLPDAANDGWTVEPPAADATDGASGIFYSQWTSDGSEVDLTVTQAPDRTDQTAATMPGSRLVEVQGHPAALSVSSQFATLTWQPRANTAVSLMVLHGTARQVEQIAATITATTASDPRMHRPAS